MKKTNVKERMCESCEEEVVIRKHNDLGWVCVDCIESYKNLGDDETEIKVLSDEEIDSLSEEDNEYEDEYEVLDELDFNRQGLNITDNGDEYN